jgi:ribosome-binding factor A
MQNKSGSYRQQRVANLINAAIVEYFNKGKLLDSRLIGTPFTITKLVVSADLKVADCYLIPFNTTLSIAEILDALYSSKYAIRAYVTDKVALKYSPKIRFFYDQGFENARMVDQLLGGT